MAEPITIARPYARAAFETALSASGAAKDGGGLAKWSQMLTTAAAVVRHDKMAAAISDPALVPTDAAAALIGVCGKGLDDKGGNFIRLLAENKRLPLLPEVARLFEFLKARHEKSVDVSITTAFPMDKAVAARMEESLGRRLQRRIRLSRGVDPALIGGAVIRAGDTVIDGSLRGRLAKLSETLA